MPTFGLIFAVDLNLGFSKDGKIPWDCPEDLNHFKRITTGCNVVMGRKSFESIGRELPNRKNIVMSTKTDVSLPNQCRNDDELFKMLGDEFAWIIGGVELIEHFVTHHPTLIVKSFVTHIRDDEQCDQKMSRLVMSFLHQRQRCDIGLSSRADIVAWLPSYSGQSNFQSLDSEYLSILRRILEQPERMTRNGPTRSMFGVTLRCENIASRFPILQSKKVFWKGIVEELLFFLSGQTDTKLLEARGVNVWKGNTSREFLDSVLKKSYPVGEMGPMYGYQLRTFGKKYRPEYEIGDIWGCDQVRDVVELLVNDPFSRRIMMTTYNPLQVSQGVLPPCHGIITQFYVDDQHRISLSTYQRSGDWFLGVPFNISSYGLLLYIIVKEVNEILEVIGLPHRYIPGDMIINFGDVHLYSNHLEAALEQLQRKSETVMPPPRLTLPPRIRLLPTLGREFFETFSAKDFVLDYTSLGVIKAEMVA